MLARKWIDRFSRLAVEVSTWSKDPQAKVGCVIVSDKAEVQSMGYNGPPPGIDDSLIYSLPDKNKYIIHAEVNALERCHSNDFLHVFITKGPCFSCALRLANSNLLIKAVYFPQLDTGSKWYCTQLDAIECLERKGIQVHIHTV